MSKELSVDVKDSVRLEAKAGCMLGDAIASSVEIATLLKKSVELTHNGVTITVCPTAEYAAIKEYQKNKEGS